MIIRLIVVLAFITVPCFATDTYYPTPSHSQISQIKKWWKPEYGMNPDEEFGIGHVYPVRLKSGERAFVASVDFPPRGRFCSVEILLVRPDLQEARQIDPHHILVSPRIREVVDLDGGRISGVVVSGLMTSAGSTAGRNTLLYFDEWQPVVLHSRAFESGDCGRALTGRSCHDEEVKWFFRDLDGDGTKDLVELILCGNAEEPDQMTYKVRVNIYLIKDTQLVPAPPGLIQTNFTESQRKAESAGSGSTDMQDHKSQNTNTRENEQLADNEVFISKCRSGLDQAVTAARDILSQFGLTSADPK